MFAKKNHAMEAELAFRKLCRDYKKADEQLQAAGAAHKQKACTAEQTGRHSDAINHIRMMQRLQKLRNSLTNNYQQIMLMHSLGSVSNVMAAASNNVQKIGSVLKHNRPVYESMLKSQVTTERTMLELDTMLEGMEDVLDYTDAGNDSLYSASRDPEFEAILSGIVNENSLKELQENEFSDLKDTENLLSVRLGNLI